MTLTQIMPTLRRSIPDPLHARSWPEHTFATVDDVVIAGVSLVRLAALCETPCVHTADACVPEARTRPALRHDVAVIVVSVTDVVDTPAGRVVLVDGDLSDAAANWHQSRLIGRVSTAAAAECSVLTASATTMTGPGTRAELPADLRRGDLLAIPCARAVTLHDIRPSTPAQARTSPRTNSA